MLQDAEQQPTLQSHNQLQSQLQQMLLQQRADNADGADHSCPSGGTAPYTLQWSNGSNSTNVSGLCAGVYTVIITDATGCSNTFTIPVSSSGGPTASGLTSTDVTCFGANDGTAQVSPVGGTAPYNIFWIPGGQTTNSVSGLSAGTYYVQIQDASGCILTDSVLINGPSQILLNQSITNTDCGYHGADYS
jgi:hypothetical protein